MRQCFYPLILLGFAGCMVTEDKSSGKPRENAPSAATNPTTNAIVADSATLHKVADDGTAGAVPLQQFNYKDPKTGTTYIMNPKWSIVKRQAPKGLAKSAGLIQTWTDWSGQVESRVYECVTPSAAQHQNSIGCQVEQGFTLVGGGAYADYGSGQGAMLWETRPLDNSYSTWVASSKDHIKPDAHYLHVYAIGLRIKDNSGNYVPKSSLIADGRLHFYSGGGTTSPAAMSSFILTFPNNETADITGPGVIAVSPGAGNLLFADYVSAFSYATDMWLGSKDHGISDPGTLSASCIYFVGMDTDSKLSQGTIPNFGKLKFNWKSVIGTSIPSGASVAYADADNGFVLAGMSGESYWTSGTGRLLFGIKPTGTYTGQVGVYGKDHLAVSAGYSIASIVEVEKSP